ncbi:hypothetical protein ACQR16_04520 [Bradyrhizobium oligotrophicum]|uniref:hypothetical protein n=1 Tax=Bradyrhizobium oligotrophicum TaxID=44255 RepID=UPI003EB7E955
MHRKSAEALASYERVLRPLVDKAQTIPKLVPRLVHPYSAAGVSLLRAVQRLISTAAISRRMAKSFTPALQAFCLPRYEALNERAGLSGKRQSSTVTGSS